MYYSLTTGAGLQTLGEEYCDIMQMQGGARPAAPPARVCLALLKSFGPYLGERLAASLDRSGMLEGLDAFGMEEEEEEDCSVAQQEEHRTQTGDGASSSPMCEAAGALRACSCGSWPLWGTHYSPAVALGVTGA